MSDESTTPTPAPATPEAAPEVGDPKPEGGVYKTQAEVDAVVKERLRREREATAKKYADYDELKAKADEWDKRKAAEQSDAEKALEANAKLQKELDKANASLEAMRLDALRTRLGNEYGLPERVALAAPGTDEDALREWMTATAADLKITSGAPAPSGPVGSPTSPPAPSSGDLEAQIREAYERGDAATAIALENRRFGVS